MSIVALKLIETGRSKPEQINNDGNTALIYACYNNMYNVALKLIETGNSRTDHIDDDNNTALTYAYQNNMFDVIKKVTIIAN